MRHTLSLFYWLSPYQVENWSRLYWHFYVYNENARRIGYKYILIDTFFDIYKLILRFFGYKIYYKHNSETRKDERFYEKCTPLYKGCQWWVYESGEWCKTSWYNIIIGRHRRQLTKLDKK